jgi:hypothetical protein
MKKDEPSVQHEKTEGTIMLVDKICEFIARNKDKRIVLLRSKEVIMWLHGNLSFLPPIVKENKTKDELKYKVLEDKWGRAIMKILRPDLKLDKQWTGIFGQHLCEELCLLEGKEFSKPVKKNNHLPDLETHDEMIEAKAETFHTQGTAGEKILGAVIKYRNVPALYSKPLRIICLGGAEKACREQYGILDGPKHDDAAKEILELHKKRGLVYEGATDILRKLVNL